MNLFFQHISLGDFYVLESIGAANLKPMKPQGLAPRSYFLQSLPGWLRTSETLFEQI